MTRRVPTQEESIEAAKAIDPIQLNRLLVLERQLVESYETVRAQQRRRREVCYELVAAGAAYADLARIMDVSRERVRQMVAEHLGVTVYELNPKNREPAESRH